MNKLSLIAIGMLLWCCTSKTETEQTAETVDSASAGGSMPDIVVQNIATRFTMSKDFRIDEPQLFIEPGASLYESANDQSAVVKEISTLLPFTQLAISETRMPEDGSPCSRYYWYQAQLPDGTTGWVSGASVLLLQQEEVSANEPNNLTVHFMLDAGIGSSDEMGLTGCDEYKIPFFYFSDTRTIQFIQTSTEQVENFSGSSAFLSTYLNWLCFISSEGGSAALKSFEANSDGILMHLGISTQIDGFDASLQVDSDHFDLISFAKDENDEPRSIRTVQCTYNGYEEGDCSHLLFSCGDFGVAEISRLEDDARELWQSLANDEKYVGKEFEITYGLVTGWPCQAGYPDTSVMQKGDVESIISFRLIEN